VKIIKSTQPFDVPWSRFLCHPNIVSVSDYFFTGSSMNIVIEHVQGINLKQFIQRIKQRNEIIEEHHIIDIIWQIAKGLRCAHARHIYHGNLKPSNIFLTAEFKVKITDFSLQQSLQDLASDSPYFETLQYQSPERFEGGGPNALSDIWSVGVIAYELINLSRPFSGENSFSLFKHIKFEDPPDFERECCSQLKDLTLQMLSKSPELRCTDIVIDESLSSLLRF
jgi:serine/threonine-protein kinase